MNNTITRRNFLKVTGFLTGGFTLSSFGFFSGCDYPAAPEISGEQYSIDNNDLIIYLDRCDTLAKAGDSASILNDEKNIYLIIARTGENRFAVARNECPHREKVLGYSHASGSYLCVSGKSEFGLDGSVLRGKSEKPLPVYQWKLDRNSLSIDLDSTIPINEITAVRK